MKTADGFQQWTPYSNQVQILAEWIAATLDFLLL